MGRLGSRVTTSSGYSTVIHPQIVFNYTQVIPKRAQNLEKSAENYRHTSNTSYLELSLVTLATDCKPQDYGQKPDHKMLCYQD